MHIPLEECKHGFLYKIFSRNLGLGVFDENTQGFIGIREKFRYEYLFTEYHWDTGPPFGTVHPDEELEECPCKSIKEDLDIVGDESGRPLLRHIDWRYRDTKEPCLEEQAWDDKDGAVGVESKRPIVNEGKGWKYRLMKTSVPNNELFD